MTPDLDTLALFAVVVGSMATSVALLVRVIGRLGRTGGGEVSGR